jgi:nucleoside-diphosphate-sugar epimerase
MTTTETVLVTGGTGFIGSYLAQALLDDDYEVVAFDATVDDALLERLDVADETRVVQGDVTDMAALARTVREPDATRIIHLAALLTDDVRTDTLVATQVNAVGTNNILEAARLFPD